MPTIQCPFCDEIMNEHLKFCTSCGRAISATEKQKVGLKPGKRVITEDEGKSFNVSRRSFEGQRQFRSFFIASSMVLFLLIVYYVTMKYVVHEKIPFGVDTMLEDALHGKMPQLPQMGSGSPQSGAGAQGSH